MGRVIAVFGGAFDPPTFAHVSIAEVVASMPGIDEVRVMPCLDTHPFGKRMSGLHVRREMLRSCLPPKAVLDDGSTQAMVCSDKTYDILRWMKSASPDDEFRPVIGLDEARQIDLWYQWEHLVSEFRFIVVERGQSLKGFNGTERLYWRLHHDYISPDPSIPHVSSSAARRNFLDFWGMHNGHESDEELDAVYDSEFSGLIPKAVFLIAVKHGLYRQD